MEKIEKVKEVLAEVANAAEIHVENLEASLRNNKHDDTEFQHVRRNYANKVKAAVREVRALRFDESLKIKERVRDLSLEELVALQLMVEARIRDIAPVWRG